MAITRSQIAKQLLAKGGRIGLRFGSEGYQGGRTDQGGAGPGPGAGSGDSRRPDMLGVSRAVEKPRGLNLASLILSAAKDQPIFNLISKMGFKNAPDFVQPKDRFGGRDEMGNRILFPMKAQGPRTMDNMPEEDEEEESKGLRLPFRAEGGSMNDQIRQAYGIGDIVKKAVRGVKKVAKSPVGKAALIGGGLGLAGIGPLSGLANTKFGTALGGFFGKGSFNPLKAITAVTGQRGPMSMTNLSGLGKLISRIPGGGVTAAITAASLLPLLGIGTGDESEEEAQAILDQSGLDVNAIREAYLGDDQYRALAFKAEGGSIDEPVAKKTMPLLDMGGQEMDLRAEGGFVPIGRMEKADDVPARLSKNEFVFTAEAVRNAGEGDVDKGAEVMYNMMKNLEAGGDVSEESQGLEGARRMFQTSQRLEEVL
jgi:hypothetical protein